MVELFFLWLIKSFFSRSNVFNDLSTLEDQPTTAVTPKLINTLITRNCDLTHLLTFILLLPQPSRDPRRLCRQLSVKWGPFWVWSTSISISLFNSSFLVVLLWATWSTSILGNTQELRADIFNMAYFWRSWVIRVFLLATWATITTKSLWMALKASCSFWSIISWEVLTASHPMQLLSPQLGQHHYKIFISARIGSALVDFLRNSAYLHSMKDSWNRDYYKSYTRIGKLISNMMSVACGVRTGRCFLILQVIAWPWLTACRGTFIVKSLMPTRFVWTMLLGPPTFQSQFRSLGLGEAT